VTHTGKWQKHTKFWSANLKGWKSLDGRVEREMGSQGVVCIQLAQNRYNTEHLWTGQWTFTFHTRRDSRDELSNDQLHDYVVPWRFYVSDLTHSDKTRWMCTLTDWHAQTGKMMHKVQKYPRRVPGVKQTYLLQLLLCFIRFSIKIKENGAIY
jgi:hypothetical protein